MSISVNNQTAPDGTQTAANFIFPTNPATIPYCTQSHTFSAAAHTFSVFAKYNGVQYLWLNIWDGAVSRRAIFDIQNGTLGSTENSPSGQTITAYGNGWYRCTISATTSANSGDLSIRFANSSSDFDSDTITGNGSDGQYIWGAQLEQGAFPTSYIPTSGSTVTRAADNAKITGTNFTDFYNQTEGTILTESRLYTVTSTQNFTEIQIDDGTQSNRIFHYIAQSNDTAKFQAWGADVVPSGVTVTPGINFKHSSSYNSQSYITCLDGELSPEGNTGTQVSLTEAKLGYNHSNNYLNGYIKRLSYYPKRLPNAQLQGLTQQ